MHKCFGIDRAGMASAILFWVLAAPASAEIYRCMDGDTTVFSDVPCSQGAEVHRSEGRISVVNPADNLDQIAASNKTFLEQRRQALTQQREYAAEQQREAQQRQRRREALEQAQRYRTVVGHLGHSAFGVRPIDPRTDSRRQRPDGSEEPTRRTLLSRSGGNQPNILR